MATLRSALSRVEEEPRLFTALGFGAGVVTSTLVVAASALFAALAEQGDELDPGTADSVDTASYFLMTGGFSVGALLVLATSVVALRTRLLPSWLAWAGVVAAP